MLLDTSPSLTGTLLLFGAIVYSGCVWYFTRRNLRAKGLRLPPGPKGRLITGNRHQLPQSESWLAFASWSKVYGTPFANSVVFLEAEM